MNITTAQQSALPATSAANTPKPFPTLIPETAHVHGWEESLFPPLELVTRPTVPTDAAAYYLNRRPQTLRSWASTEHGPIRPIRINGRLAWKVAEIKAILRGKCIADSRAEKGGKSCL